MATHVLIVEDNEEERELLQIGLSRSGFRVSGAERAEVAISMARNDPPDLFLIDLCLPEIDGFSLCAALRAEPLLGQIPRLILSGDDSVETQVKCLTEYVDDYLIKPFNLQILMARMGVLLRRSNSGHHRNVESFIVKEDSDGTNGHLTPGMGGYLLGNDFKMKNVISMLTKYSRSDAPVLISGESGTGKELAARTLHAKSGRRNGPFIPINCGAIPENLIEAELFGYEKGAFTGAISRKKGKVEMAHKGILFLDEINELPIQFQVKLLRFLEDYRVERIGGTHLVKVDVRVIAASNRDLAGETLGGRFRDDLYYRLAVLSLHMPPLRERGDDLILIAEEVFREHAKYSIRPLKGFSRGAIKAIKEYHWPGNVRQLINAIRRAIVIAEGDWISEKDIGIGREEMDRLGKRCLSPLGEAKRIVERNLIEDALARYSGNVSRAARELGVSRPTLYSLIKKHKFHA